MNNTSIKYKNHFPLTEDEQAAGFPPFTRGYETLAKKIQIITEKPEIFIEFTFTEKSVEALFSALNETKITSKINLLFHFTGSTIELAYIPVLRTLLSIFLQKKGEDFNSIEFTFYASSTTPSLNTINVLNAIGIDYLIVTDLKKWQRINELTASFPVDPLFDNKLLSEEIEKLFFNFNKKLPFYFS